MFENWCSTVSRTARRRVSLRSALMLQFNWGRNVTIFEMRRCFSSHPGSQALKHIIQNCVASFRCRILPQNKNKDLLPGNLTGFHGAEFGTYACLLAVTISWLPNLYWNLRKAVPSAPEVPDAMEIWLVKISMKASVTGWWVLASLTWIFSVTSVMTNNHSDYCLKSFCGRQQLEHADTPMTEKTPALTFWCHVQLFILAHSSPSQAVTL